MSLTYRHLNNSVKYTDIYVYVYVTKYNVTVLLAMEVLSSIVTVGFVVIGKAIYEFYDVKYLF